MNGNTDIRQRLKRCLISTPENFKDNLFMKDDEQISRTDWMSDSRYLFFILEGA